MHIVYMYVCTNVYNINGGVANIFYQSCAQIDYNQQVYEAHIQVPRCNSILGVILLVYINDPYNLVAKYSFIFIKLV
jgi:hypothetical protein